MTHPTTDGKGATQQGFRQGKIAGAERRAHPGAGHPLAMDFAGSGVGHSETELPASLLQVGEIPVATTTETEIITHHQVFHP